MTKARVVLADDYPLVHKAIGERLGETKDFEIVGGATSGAQVVPLVASTAPDLVLLDLSMPVIGGLDCLSVLREKYPEVAVIIVGDVEDSKVIEQALGAGAAAFVAKSIDLVDLPSILRQVLAGNVN